MSIEIVRINKTNYRDFLKMIHYRVTGELYDERNERNLVSENIDYGYVLDNKDFYLLAAKVDGIMAAYLAGSIIPKADKRIGTMFIDEVYTADTHRGLGLAKKLVEKIIKISKERGLWEARLTVDIDNDIARHIYRSNGFSEKECIFGRVKLND